MARETKARTRHLLELTLKVQEYNKIYPNLDTDHCGNMPIDAKVISNVDERLFNLQVVKKDNGYIVYWFRNSVKS